jgi:DNA modification methylase
VEIDPVLAERARDATGRRSSPATSCTADIPGPITHVIGNPPFDAALIHAFLDRAHGLLPKKAALRLPAAGVRAANKQQGDRDEPALVDQPGADAAQHLPAAEAATGLRDVPQGRVRTLVGFFLYREAADVAPCRARRARGAAAAGRGSVWRRAVRAAFTRLGRTKATRCRQRTSCTPRSSARARTASGVPTLEDCSVNACVTSPPYFGLRSYLPDGHPLKPFEIGLERTPEEYVGKLVEVFRQVRRVLRNDGTLWLNIGDSYAGSGRGGYIGGKSSLKGSVAGQDQTRIARLSQRTGESQREAAAMPKGSRLPAGLHEPACAAGAIGRRWVPEPKGLKRKDLIGVPWMLAFALRNDGAASPAHMRDIERMIAAIDASYDSREQWPERIAAEVERLEREHADANKGGWFLRQDVIWSKPGPMPESVKDRCTKSHEYVFMLSKKPTYYFDWEAIKEPASIESIKRYERARSDTHKYADGGPGGQTIAKSFEHMRGSKRNSFARATKYSDGDHGQKPQHREDREDVDYSQSRNKRSVWTISTQPYPGAHYAVMPPALAEQCILAGCPIGGTVLDPFGGDGTTAMVADRLQRNAVIIDLDARAVDRSEKRIAADAPPLLAPTIEVSP